MRQLMPAAQGADDAEGGGLTDAILGQAETAPEPMVDAPPNILWPTVIGVVAIFFLMLFLLMRLRVSQSVRAQKRAPVGEFFQPAGEDAEITFEDGSVADSARPRRGAHQGDLGPAAAIEVEAPDETEIEEAESATAPNEPAFEERAPSKKEGPFAKLFARKKKGEPTEPLLEEADDILDNNEVSDDFAEVVIESEPARLSAFEENEDRREEEDAEHARWREEEEAARAKAAGEREARERQEREAREAEARAHDAERERLQREADDREREYREREAEFERRKRQAAADNETREHALRRRAEDAERAVEDLRRDLANELDHRFSEFGRRLDTAVTSAERASPANDEDFRKSAFGLLEELDHRISRLSADTAGAMPPGAIGATDPEALERLSSEVRRLSDDLKRSIAEIGERIEAGGVGDLEGLREEIASLREAVASGRQASPSAPTIQLTDIVRNALPPDAYEMRAALSNHRTADCLVRLPHPPGPIAIDARFPVEAFHRLGAGGSISAENEFRRTALKHIADVAERLIVPGETAQSAMIFLPSESMYTELHARFADVVQDSYRARTWFVSPTTLMAALHTIRGVLADMLRPGPDMDGRTTLAELEALRRRVAALEAASPRNDDYLYQRDAAPEQETEDWRDDEHRAEEHESGPQPDYGDLGAQEPEEGKTGEDQVERRAPFPLR